MVSVKDKILIDRQKRGELIESMTQKGEAVIAVKCNVCGDDKTAINYAFVQNYFLQKIHNEFNVVSVHFYKTYDGEFYLVCIKETDYLHVKKMLICFEESFLGRMVDLDLTIPDGAVCRRNLCVPPRKCIYCEDVAKFCSINKKHTVEQVNAAMTAYLKRSLCELLASYSYQAMIQEVEVHPKFGLVTKESSGKHTDMNFTTFLSSAKALIPFFQMYSGEGFNITNNTFNKLRNIGRIAEESIFISTKGINTHKGANFLLGIILPSIVDCLYYGKEFSKIQENIKYISQNILNDFENVDYPQTYGEKAFKENRILGVRGEIYQGLDVAFEAVKKFYHEENPVHKILVYAMENIDDTVLLHNHDVSIIDYVKNVAKEVRESGYDSDLISKYTDEFIEKGISPGGSADIVICTLLLINVKKSFYPEIKFTINNKL